MRQRYADGTFAPGNLPAKVAYVGRKTRENRAAGFMGFRAGHALRRDIARIANAEKRSLGETICGLVRLGLGRYFELAGDEEHARVMREAMESLRASA